MANVYIKDNSHEPATKGDVRNLALRVELRSTTFDESLKEYINKLGWRIYAATIGSAAVMFVICGIYINSILK
jgi:hypothetical protein